MTVEELLTFFMGKDASLIESSEHAMSNIHLYKLAREYVEILDYVYNENYQIAGAEDLKKRIHQKEQIEFYVQQTYDLDILEIAKRCRKNNENLERLRATQRNDKGDKSSDSKLVKIKGERELGNQEFISVEELTRLRDFVLEEYLANHSVGLSQVSLCFYVRVTPLPDELYVDFNDPEIAIDFMKKMFRRCSGDDVQIGLSITRVDTVDTLNDQKKVLVSYYLEDIT